MIAAPVAAQESKGAGLGWQRRYVRALVCTDVVVVSIAMACAQMVKLQRSVTDLDPVNLYFGLLSVIVASIWLALLAAYQTRSPRIVGAGVEEYRRVISATLATIAVVAVFLMIFRPEYARGYLAVVFPLGLVLLLIGRSVGRRVLAWNRRRGNCVTSVLAVGNPGAVRSLVQSLERAPGYGYSVSGVCLTGQVGIGTMEIPSVGRPLPVLGNENDIEEALARCKADTVALTAAEHLGPEAVRELSWALDRLGVDLVISPGMIDVAGPRLTIRPVDGLPLIHVDRPQYSGTKRLQKRAFDIVVSLTILLGALPVMVAAAIAIKLTSRGPIFYRSERIGLDGRPFRMIKFRTMVDGADQQVQMLADKNEFDGGVLFKIREDPRVTSVGKILRHYSIDELPQFFNVLKGDLSVVGPRPHALQAKAENQLYYEAVEGYFARHRVKPGVTGWAQVNGWRGETDTIDKIMQRVNHDLYYIENWSIFLDLYILFMTPFSLVAKNENAF